MHACLRRHVARRSPDRSRPASVQTVLPVLFALLLLQMLPGAGDAAARQRKVAAVAAGAAAAGTANAAAAAAGSAAAAGTAGAVVINGLSGADATGASASRRKTASKSPSAGKGKPFGLKRPRPPLEVRVVTPDGREAVFRGVRERQPRGAPRNPGVIRLRVGSP